MISIHFFNYWISLLIYEEVPAGDVVTRLGEVAFRLIPIERHLDLDAGRNSSWIYSQKIGIPVWAVSTVKTVAVPR